MKRSPSYAVLARMDEKKLKAWFNKNCRRGQGEYYVETRYERLFDRTPSDIYRRLIGRVRTRNDISIYPYDDNVPARWPAKGRGRRKFFTSKQYDAARSALIKATESAYAGTTFVALRCMFKCDVFHEMGRGFFWYPDQPRAEAK